MLMLYNFSSEDKVNNNEIIRKCISPGYLCDVHQALLYDVFINSSWLFLNGRNNLYFSLNILRCAIYVDILSISGIS